MTTKAAQGGFTLVELALAVVLLGILSYSVMNSYSFLSRTKGELATRDRMERLRVAFQAAYRNNARLVDSTSTRVFRLNAGGLIFHDSTASASATAEALAQIAGFGSLSASEAQTDDFQGQFRFFVSNRIVVVMPAGYTLCYRKVAIVSPGYNRAIDPGTTMDAPTGAVTVAGDDFAVVVDGFQVQRELAEVTRERVDRLTKAYQLYFTNRYLANPTRDVSIDYFAATGTTAARWDAGGLAGNSTGSFRDASTLNFAQALGVSAADLLDGYGQAIQVNNSSTAIRHPDNATTAMSIPPYSAQVRAGLACSQFYTQSAIGSF